MAIAADLRDRIDLAGAWQLAFDPAGQGIADGWASGAWPRDRAETVQVPAVWERTHPDAEGVGFYRRVFTVPSEWAQRVLYLRFGGASYRTEVWLNGRFLGSHEGAYTPFWFDVTEAARIGDENELVVRVAGLSSKTRTSMASRCFRRPPPSSSWYYIESGLWGDVLWKRFPSLSCHDVGHSAGSAQRERSVSRLPPQRSSEASVGELALAVRSPAGDCRARAARERVTIPPGVARFRYRLELPRPQRWSCESPYLYQLRARARRRDERSSIGASPPSACATSPCAMASSS